jgi:hypothetical protein
MRQPLGAAYYSEDAKKRRRPLDILVMKALDCSLHPNRKSV